MMRLGLPILLLIAIAIAVAVRMARSQPTRRAEPHLGPIDGAVDSAARDTGRVAATPPPPTASSWSTALDRWLGAGLLDAQQATAIRA